MKIPTSKINSKFKGNKIKQSNMCVGGNQETDDMSTYFNNLDYTAENYQILEKDI